MSLETFHPLIQRWFRAKFAGPTEPQRDGWPHIAAGRNTLIAAPTGSGKTLTAFLAAIDQLLKRSVAGELDDTLRVIYVSPLRALSNDMQRNLESPLREIYALAAEEGLELAPIRVGLRTGDTSAKDRAALSRRPPQILVTTPESLYLLLTGKKSRGKLKHVETVIVDEIHALVRDKRGSHLALSLERLSALCEKPPQRVGLSATQRPIEVTAEFLVGTDPSHTVTGSANDLTLISDAPDLGNSVPINDVAGAADGLCHDQTDVDSPIPHTAAQNPNGKMLAEACHANLAAHAGANFTGAPEQSSRACREIEPRSSRPKDQPLPDSAQFCPAAAMKSVPAKNGHTKKKSQQRLLFDGSAEVKTPKQVNPSPAAVPLPSTSVSDSLPQAVTNPNSRCVIIDVGHRRPLDLAIETPVSELGAVCMHEQWAEVHARIVELIQQHRSTIIFVNTRRLAERITHQLTELLGEDQISSHHGSLSAKMRLDTEQRLKFGQLKAVVATASLELGLDVGYIDLVIQIGSPRAIATFLQRVGRSGHALGLIPKGRLFALTRDELVENMAVIRAVRQGILDKILMPDAPLDILAQQIVAEVAHQDWSTDELFELFKRAYPYRNLTRAKYDSIIHMLSEGIATTSGRSRVYLHHDQVGRRLRARKGAGLAAILGGGAIPEVATYRVVAEPDRTVVGSLDEDFAVESTRGDVFLLGNTSWRILHVRGGDVTVVDAGGAPPTIPFWFGEAPGRTLELSYEVSRLREELSDRIADPTAAEKWLIDETSCSTFAAQQIVLYATAQKAAIGLLPTQKQVVYERFFDESGGMQLVIHAPFGSRITKAWGMSMRKRFCRSFDFELQATADDDGIILSLGPQHSFPLESMFTMLNPQNARNLAEQATLANPIFLTRWRWNVIRALQVMRQSAGKKVPPALLRFRSDDLLTAVFPKLTGCKEEIVGDIPLPDHPLAVQTMEDCLFEALDIKGLIDVLGKISRQEITLIGRDTREPSPFCYELLNSNPYAFLDGGEVQERRTRAVNMRRSLSVESVSDLGRLDPLAIEQVRKEALPLIRDADELHDALLSRIVLPVAEGQGWERWFEQLQSAGRATALTVAEHHYWVPTERLPAARAAYPTSILTRDLPIPEGIKTDWTDIDARIALVRGYLDFCGPTTAEFVADLLCLTANQVFACLEYLEGEGVVLRGRFTPNLNVDPVPVAESVVAHSDAITDGVDPSPAAPVAVAEPIVEWCHRRLLARIHRLTLEGLRREIQPIEVDTFIRFLTRHHGVLPGNRLSGTNGVYQVLSQMQGLDIPAISWERDILPGRVEKYQPEWLDELCLAGEVGWGRLFPPKRDPERSRPMASLTRVAPISIYLREDLVWLTAQSPDLDAQTLSSPAQEVFELLTLRGAMFAADLLVNTRLLPTQLDDVLGELITQGFVTADGFGGLRRLIAEKSSTSGRDAYGLKRGAVRTRQSNSGVGRWSLWRASHPNAPETDRAVLTEQWAWQLLRRWGVMFRDLLTRESGAPNWFDLVQLYRRLEARGEIRGGRFIAGVSGEQFALGDTVRTLRRLRDELGTNELVVVSGADPLNLIGILTPQARIVSTASNRVAYWNGKPIAALQGGEVILFGDIPKEIAARLADKFRMELMHEVNETEIVLETKPSAPVSVAPKVDFPEPVEQVAGKKSPSKPGKHSGPNYPNRIPRPRIS
ncbi:MAG: cshB [Planctomycetaceae bacterium]|nr:cshB [Planctomycetaceae bacterium]